MIPLTILEFLKFVWINMNAILMISAKLATPGLFEITAFSSEVYDVTILVPDVIFKILLDDSNYVLNLVLWSISGNCSISTREVIIALIL